MHLMAFIRIRSPLGIKCFVLVQLFDLNRQQLEQDSDAKAAAGTTEDNS